MYPGCPLNTTGRVRPDVDDGGDFDSFATIGRSFVNPLQFSQRESFFFWCRGFAAWASGWWERGGEVDLVFFFLLVAVPRHFRVLSSECFVWNRRVGGNSIAGRFLFLVFIYRPFFLIN